MILLRTEVMIFAWRQWVILFQRLLDVSSTGSFGKMLGWSLDFDLERGAYVRTHREEKYLISEKDKIRIHREQHLATLN